MIIDGSSGLATVRSLDDLQLVGEAENGETAIKLCAEVCRRNPHGYGSTVMDGDSYTRHRQQFHKYRLLF